MKKGEKQRMEKINEKYKTHKEETHKIKNKIRLV
jgi:hypothetical protein